MMFMIKCIIVLSMCFTFVLSQKKIIGKYGDELTDQNFLVTQPGSTLTLTCPFSEEFKWTFNDYDSNPMVLNFNNTRKYIQKNNVLIIKDTKLNDTGLYYCESKGESQMFTVQFYTITKTSNSTVSTKIVSEEMNHIKIEEKKINEKDKVSVSCTCTTGSPKVPLTMKWSGGHYYKRSEKYSIQSKKEGNSLTETLSLVKAENNPELYGKYVCTCIIISQKNVSREVYMKTPPIFKETRTTIRTNEGTEVALECDVWAYPSIDPKSVYWMFQNKKLSLDVTIAKNSTRGPGYISLIIPKANENYRGLYTCHASNELSNNTMGIMIRVKGKYAVLWPLIGIIIQLIILAVIITVYEVKKKREQSNSSNSDQPANKLAMADSVNAGDRPGESSDVRQRLVKT